MSSDRATLEFYAKEAAAYAARSDKIGVSKNLGMFVGALPSRAAVLDLGCGTGRETRTLIDCGLNVTAVDGSPEMAREAEKRTGRSVRVQLFEELNDIEAFDGIWANASLLHVPRADLAQVFGAVYRALKPNGLLFASFKSGDQEGRDKLGRYYNYLNRDEIEAHLRNAGAWTSLELNESRGKGYDEADSVFVGCLARKSG